MTYNGPKHRLFEVPELVAFICRYSSIAQCARLAQASRSLFNIAAPFVWEKPVGAHNVLRLLSGVIVTVRVTERSMFRQNYSITIPDAEEVNFDRFDCYAPFIKHLEIYPRDSKDYLVKGWRNLSELAKQRPILPNLVKLTLAPTDTLTTHEQCLWIRTFLSPSLNSIQVYPDSLESVPIITQLAAATLLQQIASNSPNLQRLALYPASTVLHETEKNGFAILEFWSPSFYDCLPTLRLRELSCTTEILSPEHFNVLSNLPTLESLEVRHTWDTIASFRLSSPPSLKHFALHSTRWSQFRRIWGLGLFASLTSLEISFDDYRGSENIWATEMMSLISEASPILASLCIDFGDMGFELNNMVPLQPLATLPLRAVSLKSVEMMEEPALSQMITAWPLVTKLEIPDLVFSLDELYHFARLPNLEHLVVGLSFESLEIKSTMPTTTSLAFHTLESSNDVEVDVSLSSLARHLLILWPNIRQVIWTDTDIGEYSKKNLVIAGALNEFITSFREAANLK